MLVPNTLCLGDVGQCRNFFITSIKPILYSLGHIYRLSNHDMVFPNNPRFGVIWDKQKNADKGYVSTNKELQIIQYALYNDTFNLFLVKVLILYPLKTCGFLVFSGGIKLKHWPLSEIISNFVPSENTRKTRGFLVFSGGIK